MYDNRLVRCCVCYNSDTEQDGKVIVWTEGSIPYHYYNKHNNGLAYCHTYINISMSFHKFLSDEVVNYNETSQF